MRQLGQTGQKEQTEHNLQSWKFDASLVGRKGKKEQTERNFQSPKLGASVVSEYGQPFLQKPLGCSPSGSLDGPPAQPRAS